jgi:hypothetical protein
MRLSPSPLRRPGAVVPRLAAFLWVPAVLWLALALTTSGVASGSPQSETPRREQREEWWTRAGKEVRSKHYRILSDLGAEETRLYGQHLDLYYEEYARRFSGLAQQAPEIPFVLMFRREADYLEVLRNRYGVQATGSGGMFFVTPAGAALAFFVESLPRSRVFHVVQHEGFHQYAHSRFAGTLPPWVNEGLAEFFGASIVIDGRVIVGQSTEESVTAIKRAIDLGATIPFLRLLTMSGDEWNANVRTGGAAMQYLQAWSMVQFLGWADGGRYLRAFDRYLQLLHGGMASDRAFVQAFGTNDVESFERAWRKWASECRPSSLVEAAARLNLLAEGLRLLSRDGVKVESLEDLVSQLREREFAIEVSVHGRTMRLEASESILLIPKDDLAKAAPRFELIPPQLKRSMPARAKRLEEKHPTPPAITTRGLEPRELTLEWSRVDDSGDFNFRMRSPKEAPKAPKAPRQPKEPPARGDETPSKEPPSGGRDPGSV